MKRISLRLSKPVKKSPSLTCLTTMEQARIDFKRTDGTEKGGVYAISLAGGKILVYGDVSIEPIINLQLSYFTVTPFRMSEKSLLLRRRDDSPTSNPYKLVLLHFFDPQTPQEWMKSINTWTQRTNAAITIQRSWHRARLRKKAGQIMREIRNRAAISVQRTWRSHHRRTQWRNLVPMMLVAKRNSAAAITTSVTPEEVDFEKLAKENGKDQIVFEKKKGGKILSATLPKLIEHIIKTEDTRLIKVFIAAIPSYTHPFSVLHLLLSYLKTSDHTALEGLVRVLRVWLEVAPEDFELPVIHGKFEEVLVFVRKCFGRERAKDISSMISPKSPQLRSISPKLRRAASLIKTFIDLEPLEAARQMTLSGFSLIQEIRLRELNNLTWQKGNSKQTAPMIHACIDRSNNLSRWVTASVLDADEAMGLTVMEFWISTADHCLQLNNFSDLVAISCGLQHHAVSRLKWRLSQLSPESEKTLNQINTVCSMDKNYKVLRGIIKKSSPPYIPMLALSLRDLVFIEENPTIVDGKISIEKAEMFFSVVENIKRGCSVVYDLTAVPSWQALLWPPQHSSNENSLWETSLKLEPRDSMTPDLSRSLELSPRAAKSMEMSPRGSTRLSQSFNSLKAARRFSVEDLFRFEQSTTQTAL